MSLIFDIKRFALNDGPGIRTTLFMKGCPLRCVWCHNPEGLTSTPVKLYTKKKCIGCQSCVDVCPEKNLTLTPDGIRDLGHCLSCGRCTDECPTLALQMAGKEYTMPELMAIIEKERQVMEQSGGGVTVCGGEPFMHADYLCQLLDELGVRHFHRTVDTTLFTSPENVRRVAQRCELFLVDLKLMDSDKHRRYTGVPNEQILQNIRLVSELAVAPLPEERPVAASLSSSARDYSAKEHPVLGDIIAESSPRFWIRIPLIGGINLDDENLQQSADFLCSLPTPPEMVNLLVYHDIGKGKHTRMGTTYNPDALQMLPPTPDEQQHALDIFLACGLHAKIGG